jgi:hypothetical protein
MALVVMLAGLLMMSSVGGFGNLILPFLAVWVLFGLGGAAVAFYNAFSKGGMPLYEIDMDDNAGGFCPRCGKPVGSEDEFCRHCGASMK